MFFLVLGRQYVRVHDSRGRPLKLTLVVDAAVVVRVRGPDHEVQLLFGHGLADGLHGRSQFVLEHTQHSRQTLDYAYVYCVHNTVTCYKNILSLITLY